MMRPCDLDDILITDMLSRRARRARVQDENLALQKLMQCFAHKPETLLQEMVATCKELCHADAVGITIKESLTNGSHVYRWTTTSKHIDYLRGHAIEWDKNPCALVVNRGAAQLFHRPSRFYRGLYGLPAMIMEALLVPWEVDGKTVGAVWILAHTQHKKFDAEDLRLTQSMAAFTSLAIRIGEIEKSKRNMESYRSAAAVANQLAHELNNPLQALTNTLTLLDQERNAKVLRVARQQLERMITLVKTILELQARNGRVNGAAGDASTKPD